RPAAPPASPVRHRARSRRAPRPTRARPAPPTPGPSSPALSSILRRLPLELAEQPCDDGPHRRLLGPQRGAQPLADRLLGHPERTGHILLRAAHTRERVDRLPPRVRPPLDHGGQEPQQRLDLGGALRGLPADGDGGRGGAGLGLLDGVARPHERLARRLARDGRSGSSTPPAPSPTLQPPSRSRSSTTSTTVAGLSRTPWTSSPTVRSNGTTTPGRSARSASRRTRTSGTRSGRPVLPRWSTVSTNTRSSLRAGYPSIKGTGLMRADQGCVVVRRRAATASSARRYESKPNPATVPVATAPTTECARNASRAAGLLRCTSTRRSPDVVTCAAASRTA